MARERPLSILSQVLGPPTSEVELFQSAIASSQRGETREPLHDMTEHLQLKGITHTFETQTVHWSQGPFLVTPNHFIRPIHQRRTPFTTGESMTASALTSIALAQTHSKELIWVSKKFSPKELLINRLERETQNASEQCYGWIPINEQSFGIGQDFFDRLSQPLIDGKHLGLFPELKASTHMHEYFP